MVDRMADGETEPSDGGIGLHTGDENDRSGEVFGGKRGETRKALGECSSYQQATSAPMRKAGGMGEADSRKDRAKMESRNHISTCAICQASWRAVREVGTVCSWIGPAEWRR